MWHIFISYSREDFNFASRIVQALAANDLDTWIDWKSIPKGEDWEQEIYRGVEEADAFLFLISPESVKSKMCNKEIMCAVENRKRILPVFIRGADVAEVASGFREEKARTEILKRNCLFCREKIDDFNAAIEEIRRTIQTNYEWLQYHTKLQVKALDWEKTKDGSRLIRGRELLEAEQRFAGAESSKDPPPTDLQRRFIAESRRILEEEKSKRRNELRITGIVLGWLLAGLVIAILAVVWFGGQVGVSSSSAQNANATAKAEATRAEEQARARATAQANAEIEQNRADQKQLLARSGELAAKSADLQPRDPIVSLLMSVEAFKLADNLQTRNVLYSSSHAYPQISRFLHGGGGSQALAYSHEGRLIATTDAEGDVIEFWDPASGKLIQSVGQTGKKVRGLAFSSDDKLFASANDTGLDLWTASGGRVSLGRHLSNYAVSRVLFSPNGQILISGGSDNFATLWDVMSGHAICSVELVNPVIALAFSPDGRTWASSDGYSIRLWDTGCSSIDFPTKYHPGSPADLAFSPDGRAIVFSYQFNGDYKVMFLDVSNGDIARTFNVEDFVDRLAFQPNADVLATSSRDGRITLWDTATGKVLTTFYAYTSLFEGLSFNPEGTILASASFDGTIILWNMVASPSNRTLTDTDVIAGVAFSPDGKTLASGNMEGTITLWDLVTEKAIHSLEGHPTTTVQLSFDPDGSALSSLSDDGALTVWDLATWQPIRTESNHYQTFRDTTPDGKYLLYMPGNNSIILMDAATGKPYGQPMAGSTDQLERMAFSPDAKTLATAGDDGTVMLWDLATTAPVLSLAGHIGSVSRVAFSPDGTMLASGGADKTIRLWDIDPQAWLSNVCDRVGRNFTQYEWNQYFPDEPYRLTCLQWPAGE